MTRPGEKPPGDNLHDPPRASEPEASYPATGTRSEHLARYRRRDARSEELIRGTNAVQREPANKSRVSSKGQVTIPKAVRDCLGLTPGTEVEFELEDGAARIKHRIRYQGLQLIPQQRKRGLDPVRLNASASLSGLELVHDLAAAPLHI